MLALDRVETPMAASPAFHEDDSVSTPQTAGVEEPRLSTLSHGGGCGCKIAPGILADMLREMPAMVMPQELLVGTESSDDAAVYRLNDEQALVATTDFFMPIVDDPHDFGAIAATNAISDVYAMGAKPIMALALVGMPISVLSTQTIGKILAGGQSVCARAGIPIAGGHSIDSVEPIYGLVAMGLVHPDHIKTNKAAKPGDYLVLGKPLGVGVYSAALKKHALSLDQYRSMVAITTQLNTPGPDLARLSGVHAITDVTGFGLAGHALEMAKGSGHTVELDWGAVPLLPDAQALVQAGMVTGASGRNWTAYGAEISMGEESPLVQQLLSDPQTSGGLLVSCAGEALNEVLSVFQSHGFSQAACVGRITDQDQSWVRVVNV